MHLFIDLHAYMNVKIKTMYICRQRLIELLHDLLKPPHQAPHQSKCNMKSKGDHYVHCLVTLPSSLATQHSNSYSS